MSDHERVGETIVMTMTELGWSWAYYETEPDLDRPPTACQWEQDGCATIEDAVARVEKVRAGYHDGRSLTEQFQRLREEIDPILESGGNCPPVGEDLRRVAGGTMIEPEVRALHGYRLVAVQFSVGETHPNPVPSLLRGAAEWCLAHGATASETHGVALHWMYGERNETVLDLYVDSIDAEVPR